jgi:hypothetical protein
VNAMEPERTSDLEGEARRQSELVSRWEKSEHEALTFIEAASDWDCGGDGACVGLSTKPSSS